MNPPNPARVGIYVDGFNLYFGMRAAGLRAAYWLDIDSLTRSFLEAGQVRVLLKYFTARVRGNYEKSRRQSAYLDALAASGTVSVYEGRYTLEPFKCPHCGAKTEVPKEKQTDTRIAVEMVADAFDDRWDSAIVLSGDSDLVPPIQFIRERFPAKRLICAFPVLRRSKDLERAGHGTFHVNEQMLRNHQLSDEVVVRGQVNRRPEYWK